MPNGRQARPCDHCGLWLGCHPWGDPPRWYCDDCWDWWDLHDLLWQLYDVLLLRQSHPSSVQCVLVDENLGHRIASFLLDWPPRANPFTQLGPHHPEPTPPPSLDLNILD